MTRGIAKTFFGGSDESSICEIASVASSRNDDLKFLSFLGQTLIKIPNTGLKRIAETQAYL